jgi:polar amino acid transport system substrate-binding protein
MLNGSKRVTTLLATMAMALFAVFWGSAQAAEPQTIDDIIKKGTIVVGVSTTTPIFGLIGKDGAPEGYDPDVARLLAKYLGVKVEFVPVTGANRIPQLLAGRVDVLLCLFGFTPERAQQVWYSMPYAYEAATLVAPASVKVSNVDELKGKRVGVPRGAMQDIVLTPLAQEKGFQLQRFDDEATELQALIAGQIDLGGTGLLVNQRLNKSDPGKDYQVKIILRPLHFGIGLRRGEVDKLQWLNTFVYTIKNNGELDAISRKWRGMPLENLPVF